MQIVIDIPEDDYILATKEDFSAIYNGNHIAKAIKNGTPLPKGHGRLVDESKISLAGIQFKTELDHAKMCGVLNSTPTVLEADRCYSE